MHLFTPIRFTLYYQQHNLPQLTLIQRPPFPRLTTPLSLRGGLGERLCFPSPTKQKVGELYFFNIFFALNINYFTYI